MASGGRQSPGKFGPASCIAFGSFDVTGGLTSPARLLDYDSTVFSAPFPPPKNSSRTFPSRTIMIGLPVAVWYSFRLSMPSV
jgi:hypothetical protein